jgi:hypothetical protein
LPFCPLSLSPPPPLPLLRIFQNRFPLLSMFIQYFQYLSINVWYAYGFLLKIPQRVFVGFESVRHLKNTFIGNKQPNLLNISSNLDEFDVMFETLAPYSGPGRMFYLTLILTCFIAITKAKANGWKYPLLPYPLHSPVGKRGKRGANSTALLICLIKTWVTLKLSSKAYWKWSF